MFRHRLFASVFRKRSRPTWSKRSSRASSGRRLRLHPVSQPRVTDLHLHDGQPLRFTAAFEVLPEIKLEGYKELRADKPEIAVSEADVEQALAELREQHASFTVVEGRALADGDFAQVSLDGNPQTGEGQPVHMDEVLVEIA